MVCIKLSEIKIIAPAHLAMDENKYVCRGYILRALGFDLENLPEALLEPCLYVESPKREEMYPIYRKVHVRDIVGTSYEDYGGDSWLAAYLKVKRLDYYIENGCLTKGKYMRLMKQFDLKHDRLMVHLSLTSEGLVVDGNGNHRVSVYKMMYLADILNGDRNAAEKAHRLYWLHAKISIPNGINEENLKTIYGHRLAKEYIMRASGLAT